MIRFLIKAFIYIVSLAVSWYAMQAWDYEKVLKKGHVQQAQVLYFMLMIALAYLVSQFFIGFIYPLTI